DAAARRVEGGQDSADAVGEEPPVRERGGGFRSRAVGRGRGVHRVRRGIALTPDVPARRELDRLRRLLRAVAREDEDAVPGHKGRRVAEADVHAPRGLQARGPFLTRGQIAHLPVAAGAAPLRPVGGGGSGGEEEDEHESRGHGGSYSERNEASTGRRRTKAAPRREATTPTAATARSSPPRAR